MRTQQGRAQQQRVEIQPQVPVVPGAQIEVPRPGPGELDHIRELHHAMISAVRRLEPDPSAMRDDYAHSGCDASAEVELSQKEVPMPYQVVIIGAGFGGIGMAIALKRAGIEDFVVVDRADDLGGTWRDNSYPGLSCDIPSHL
jgi:NADPH-dependent 2,4-dienoyl-CoA reductase/sulfur reductase-like enzyme